MPYYESPYRTIKRAVLAEREAELAASGGSPADVQMGIAWWNGLTRKERMTVLTQAGQHKHDPSVADTWHLWKAGVVSRAGFRQSRYAVKSPNADLRQDARP